MEALLQYLNSERGRRTALARELGISVAAISMWKRVPPDRVVKISQHTGIAREKLCPEVFGLQKAGK